MDEFYNECAELLGATHEGKEFPYHKRTRWNNRSPGRGRFPGYGIIRVFGDVVHIALNAPVQHIEVFPSKEKALDFLRSLGDQQ